jgi:hypothetical protein
MIEAWHGGDSGAAARALLRARSAFRAHAAMRRLSALRALLRAAAAAAAALPLYMFRVRIAHRATPRRAHSLPALRASRSNAGVALWRRRIVK